jgi:uncharacterized protein YbjT (DUF2867 family)
MLVVRVACSELLWGQARSGGAVCDVVIGPAADERHVAGRELERGSRILEPQPRMTSYDGVDRELDGARKTQAPGRLGDRPREDAARCACPGEMFLEHVHVVSVSRNDQSARRIDPRATYRNHCVMTKASKTILVLGGTGKTGTRVASRLTESGHTVRTAARHGADARFDWDDPATHRAAVDGVERIYLVAPVMRTRFAAQVSAFLDLAEAAGVEHITLLSAYGIDMAPPAIALRAVELDLMERTSVTHSIVRPAWFMQNFSETFLKPIDGAITVPTGDGSEAFVDAEDIAAVAAATLTDPSSHAGAQYAPTGPDRLTMREAAQVIGSVIGQPIRHVDIDRRAWVDALIASGVPNEYGETLMLLTETIASGSGSRPNDDVHAVTGTPPTSFAEFAQRTASAWAVEVPG